LKGDAPMTRCATTVMTLALLTLFAAARPAAVRAQAPAAPLPALIALPAPRTTGGKPLLDALRERRSTREFLPRELPAQLLSDLLWAADGINRADAGKRTAPSARNWQEVDVFVFLAGGVYRYDAKANALEPVAGGDRRALAGAQPFVATAPVNLLYVADTARMTGAKPADYDLYAGADAAFIAQNVYLFCASEGLAAVVRAMVDREAAAKTLGLAPTQRVVLAQTVGYPGEPAPHD
jgi:nitroreductase